MLSESKMMFCFFILTIGITIISGIIWNFWLSVTISGVSNDVTLYVPIEERKISLNKDHPMIEECIIC